MISAGLPRRGFWFSEDRLVGGSLSKGRLVGGESPRNSRHIFQHPLVLLLASTRLPPPYHLPSSFLLSFNNPTLTYQTPHTYIHKYTINMSKFNPLSYLPSRATAMRWLWYLVLLLVKFIVMLWENELPGRHSSNKAEGAQVCRDRRAFTVFRVDFLRMCPTRQHLSLLRSR